MADWPATCSAWPMPHGPTAGHSMTAQLSGTLRRGSRIHRAASDTIARPLKLCAGPMPRHQNQTAETRSFDADDTIRCKFQNPNVHTWSQPTRCRCPRPPPLPQRSPPPATRPTAPPWPPSTCPPAPAAGSGSHACRAAPSANDINQILLLVSTDLTAQRSPPARSGSHAFPTAPFASKRSRADDLRRSMRRKPSRRALLV